MEHSNDTAPTGAALPLKRLTDCTSCAVYPHLMTREEDREVLRALREGFHMHLTGRAHGDSGHAAWITVRAAVNADVD